MVSQRTNWYLYWAAICVNLLSINTASMYSWSSPSIPKLTSNDLNINPLGSPITSSEESLVASIATLGSVVGTVIGAIFADKIGRKRTLILFSTPFIVCNIIIANARNILLLYIARLCLGLASGCVLSVLPSYVADISEDSNRGAMGSIFGIMISIGHCLTFGIGPLVSIKTFSYILLIPVCLFFMTFVTFFPESPYYFLERNNTNEANKSLKKFRTNISVEKELLYLSEVVKESTNKKASWKDITSSVATKKGLLICCGLLSFQQLMGIAVVLLYLQPILEASGNIIPSYVASLIIGFIQIVSVTASTLVIDRVGRKVLLNLSAIGCLIPLFSLGTYFVLQERNYNLDAVFWVPVASLIAFYIFFNIGYATIPWTMAGELFANNVKSLCASLASALCLTLSFLIGFIFPYVRDAVGMGGAFYAFGVAAILSCVFVVYVVPETKGKSFQEIQYELNGKQKLPQDYDSS